MKNIDSISAFQSEMISNPQLQQAFKEDPIKASQQLSSQIPNTLIYQIVVISLGAAVLLVIGAVVYLSAISTEKNPINASVLTILTAISSAAIGALAGLLAPTPKGN